MEFAEVYAILLRVLYFFGLAPFTLSQNKSKMRHKFIDYFAGLFSFIIICVASLLAIALQLLTERFLGLSAEKRIEITGNTLTGQNLQSGISSFCYVGMIILSTVKTLPHMNLFNTLMTFDRDIVEFFQYDLNYKKHKQRINTGFSWMIVYNVVISSCSLVYLTSMRTSFMSYRLMIIYIAGQTYPQFYTFHYCTMCAAITYRFKAVENLAKSNLTRSDFENLVTINMRLRQCVHSLNEALGFGQFLNIMNNSIILTVQVFLILHMIFSPNGVTYLHWNIASSWWFLFFMAQTVFVAKVGNDLKGQVLVTNKAMSENTARRYQGKEIELLSGCPLDKLYGHKLQCSAGGFFVIDYSLIMMMISTVTTYLVVLLQFNQEEN